MKNVGTLQPTEKENAIVAPRTTMAMQNDIIVLRSPSFISPVMEEKTERAEILKFQIFRISVFQLLKWIPAGSATNTPEGVG